ncbi:polyprenyl synthetase family protein [Streptomyces sp. NPDC059176]|uniref:polyprenyl synthetase family protein n=1 Tax=Streptomyces sp. NPDC059176 TaxID=3346758 RepID=UPI0036BC50E1
MTVPTRETAPDQTGAAPVPGILRRCRELVRPALATAVERLHPWPAEMAAYSLGWCEVGGAPAVGSAGKGVRQAMAVLSAEAAGASGGAGVPGAVAVELVHTFSLMHDDIMDGDATRRRRPTVWKAYGTGPAVLAGDALFALAVETLAGTDAAHRPASVRHLAAALTDLVRGQADDLLFESRPWTGPERVGPDEYRAMAEHKTGALLGCAAALGAVLAGADGETVTALERAGRHAGVAFQVVDDMLGIWGTPGVTGKPVHGDLLRGKKTFPVLAALSALAHGSASTPERAAARALAELLSSTDVLDESAASRAAGLVEEAGGRAAALQEAQHHMAAVHACLDTVALAPRPVAELRALLAFLVDREM